MDAIYDRVVEIIREEFNCGLIQAQHVANLLDEEGLLADYD